MFTALPRHFKIIMFQLTVDGVNLEIGRNALLLVEEELRLGQEPVLTLPLLSVETTVREKALKLKTAIPKTAIVIFKKMITNLK